MKERRGAIIVCRILAPLNAPPLPSDATILNYLNDREGIIFFCRILAPPPLPETSQYLLTILMAERGGGAPIPRKKLYI